MASSVWVGFDLGTTGVRALAVSAEGEVVGRGSRPVTSRRDGGRHEQDPADWWDALGGASRQALAEVDVDAGRVAGVATCGTSGTVLLSDRFGTPLTAGLMYDDDRAGAQAERIGAPRSWALARVLWLLEDSPALAGVARVVHQPDFVNRRLVGTAVPTDSSHALKSGYDLVAEAWPVGSVPAGMLPDVVRPGAPLGLVGSAGAAHTGLPVGTPVIAGMTDGCAAQIAAGALQPGDWSSVLGTTLVLKGVSGDLIRDPDGVLYSHRLPDGEWLPGGASSAGAGALQAAFPGRDLSELTLRARGYADTPVLAYPLVGRGERFPFCEPDAASFVVGTPADDGELFAALLQGLAFVERLCFDVLDLRGAPAGGRLTLSGGAAANAYLSQLRASVLDRPVRVVEHGESAFGMAMLAAAAAGGADGGGRLADVAERMVRTGARFAPSGDSRAGRYGEFVAELSRRGWLGRAAATHARGRSGLSS